MLGRGLKQCCCEAQCVITTFSWVTIYAAEAQMSNITENVIYDLKIILYSRFITDRSLIYVLSVKVFF